MNRLADFIQQNLEEIIGEWESFARGLPPGTKMSRHMLRDHSREILNFIAKDISTVQSDSEQVTKSHGEQDTNKPTEDTAAEIHGALRLEDGFDIVEMASEYRALRASVTKLWMAETEADTKYKTLDLIRFNESIDQALAESISSFTKNLDASRDLFLGILGHDLRNPLGAITMSAHLLKIKGSLNDTQTMLANQIEFSSERAVEIVNDLLDLTRARMGTGIPIEKQAMDFGEVAQKIVAETQILHPTKRIEVNGVKHAIGQGDASRIKQVLSNLLSNAIQYGQPDSPVTVTIERNTRAINLSVHNFGTPIPSSAISTIFDSLVRGPGGEIEQRKGSTNLGLGLYIAKMIVLAHSGTLSVASTQTDGTKFTALFPL